MTVTIIGKTYDLLYLTSGITNYDYFKSTDNKINIKTVLRFSCCHGVMIILSIISEAGHKCINQVSI